MGYNVTSGWVISKCYIVSPSLICSSLGEDKTFYYLWFITIDSNLPFVMKRSRKSTKKYYISLRKGDNSIVIATSKQEMANHLGLSVRIINRRMKRLSIYDEESFTIWSGVPITRIERGFAVRSRDFYR